MRNLLVLSALLAATSRPSPACGFYAPRVFMVQHTFAPHRDSAFVLADHRDVPTEGWSLFAPNSYDSTQIADAPAIQPVGLTLLGSGAPLEVTATKRVFVRGGFGEHKPMGAWEVDTSGKQFTLAMTGKHVDVAFAALQSGTFSTDDAKFLADNKLAWTDAMVEQLGNIEAITAYVDGGYKTVVRREGLMLGQFAGVPVGRLDADGVQFLVIDNGGDARSIYI